MSVFYVKAGGTGTGESPGRAAGSWRDLEIRPGDTVLFSRGSLFRDALIAPAGREGAPVHFGAYGEGETPVFCGSVDLSDPDDWECAGENLWRCRVDTGSEACHFIFDGGDRQGILAWDLGDLNGPEKWHDTRIGTGVSERDADPGVPFRLLLWCRENPGIHYRSVECAVFGARKLCSAEAWVEFSDLAFVNSGVHGFAVVNAHHIRMTNCTFRNIGGAVWSREKRIRFGNAFELWDDCHDVVMEGCTCEEIYDSCFTHQGPGEACVPARNLSVRGNVFRRYGMAAYEARDKAALNSEFRGNTCLDAGMGFAAQDETPPRRSEIWPQPMGHHLFLWRMEHATPGACVRVEDNLFGAAPVGAAVYAIISPEARAQFRLRGNRYTPASERMLPDPEEDA